MKAARHLLPFAAAALLGACSTVGGMPRGQQTADYKIEAAGGVQAEVAPPIQATAMVSASA